MDLNRKRAIGKFVVTAIFLAVGIFVFNYYVTAKTMGKASLTWPATEGIVVRVVHKNTRIRNEERGTFKPSTGIEYKYHVNGREHTGDRLRYGSQDDWAVGPITPGEGKPTKIHFNPESPSISIVEPGYQGGKIDIPRWGGIACIAVVVLACAQGIVLLVTKNQ
jgi:hypothetical protein